MILKTNLYDHQIKAIEKLSKIKVGALYMEQGTGKTRTALELINLRYKDSKINHILWLCPCSVKRTIEKEIEKHATTIDCITICGIETLSSSIKTNVELIRLVKDKNVYLIVDESNLVKNHKAKRTQNILRLAEDCKYKLILNGTPISRNEADLFAQWQIVDWRILGYHSFWSFSNNHVIWDENVWGKIKDMRNVDYLVKKISPYTYQVKKEECTDLPSKVYKAYYYDLTTEQYVHYAQIADELMMEVDELQPHTIYRLFTALQNVISGYNVYSNKGKLSKKPLFKNLLDNPRIRMLQDIISRIDKKVIIFCKYTKEINDIVKMINDQYGEGAAIPFNGSVKQKERQENIDKFEETTRFFVANKVTAGYGLNLQFCHYVIYYSNDWDYATRSQSEDRVHRIGQENIVQIIDICADGTLDERILSCLRRKENLVDSFKGLIQKMKDKKDLNAIKLWVNRKNKKCNF